ncbi:MAG: hypothetical protein Q9228_004122 [Teloschistes exilis]
MEGSSRNEINVSSSGIDIRSSGVQISRIRAKEIHISGLDVNISGLHTIISGEKITISAVRVNISGNGTGISGSEVKISAGSVNVSGDCVKIKGNKVEMSAPTVSVTGAGFETIESPNWATESSSDDDFSDEGFYSSSSSKKSTRGRSKPSTKPKPEDNSSDEGHWGRRRRTRGRSNTCPEPKPEDYYSFGEEYFPKGEAESPGGSSGANGAQGQQGRASDWWQRNGAAPKPKARDYRESGSSKSSSMPKVEKTDGFVDFYALLSISPSCSQAEVEKAVKIQRIRFHPDKLKKEGMTPQELHSIDEQAKVVGGAAEVLMDPVQRIRYDARRLFRV